MAQGIRQSHTQGSDVWIRFESTVFVLQHLEALVSIKEQEGCDKFYSTFCTLSFA